MNTREFDEDFTSETTYQCPGCKRLFGEPKEYKEVCGDWINSYFGCPFCGDGFEEVKKCEKCGEFIPVDEINLIEEHYICDDCIEED